MKKILVILGHPDSQSFNAALARAYVRGARAAHATVRFLKLGELSFDPILHHGYREIQPLEPDLLKVQNYIKWADHLIWVYPTWWGSMPALLKGLLDRLWLPGFAFKFTRPYLHQRLLRGRSARLIITMDTPSLIYRFIFRSPGENIMKRSVLRFSGVRPVRVTRISWMVVSTKNYRRRWLKKIERLGLRLR